MSFRPLHIFYNQDLIDLRTDDEFESTGTDYVSDLRMRAGGDITARFRRQTTYPLQALAVRIHNTKLVFKPPKRPSLFTTTDFFFN